MQHDESQSASPQVKRKAVLPPVSFLRASGAAFGHVSDSSRCSPVQIHTLNLPHPALSERQSIGVAPRSPKHYHLSATPPSANKTPLLHRPASMPSLTSTGIYYPANGHSPPVAYEQRRPVVQPWLAFQQQQQHASTRPSTTRRSQLPKVATVGSRPEIFAPQAHNNSSRPFLSRALQRHPTFFASPPSGASI